MIQHSEGSCTVGSMCYRSSSQLIHTVNQETLDQYFLSQGEKERLEEEKVVNTLKAYGGSVRLEFDRKDQDAEAFFALNYDSLMAIVRRLKRKGVLDYRSDYDLDHVNFRRIFFAKRMRTALATPVIGA